MRDPTINVAIEEGAIAAAVEYLEPRLRRLKTCRFTYLEEGYPDDEGRHRIDARDAILDLPDGTLPEHVRDLILEMLSPKPVSRKRGRYSQDEFWARDQFIVKAVECVVARGFAPTRNQASEHQSACSIVTAALARLGENLSEAAVVKIWRNRGPTFSIFDHLGTGRST
jgi:hypothetical protein